MNNSKKGEYQFVSRNKWRIENNKFQRIIKTFQWKLTKEKITFQFYLVGSAKRRLVTKKSGNIHGYDFDYQLSLNKGKDFNEQKLRKSFFLK